MVRSPLALVLACLLGVACDGTLSGTHATRGVLPVVYPEPEPPPEPVELHLGEPAQIRAQHMLVMHRDSRNAPPTVVRTREEARERAEEALAKIKAGGNVDEIFGAYSDERGAAERNGDLGQFSRKMMVKKFSDAAFKLKVGEVSDLVESEFGFHIIRRTE
jgi:hypothetical protein